MALERVVGSERPTNSVEYSAAFGRLTREATERDEVDRYDVGDGRVITVARPPERWRD